jgi:DNA-binding CsgD family transcriptional regulator
MNKLILLIHSSEIIRKGLASILRSFFNVEIIQAENAGELISWQDLKNYSIICIVEKPENKVHEYLQFLQNHNQLKLIGYNNDKNRDSNHSSAFNYLISQNTTALELQEIFSKCWKMGLKSTRTQENDELTSREKEVLKLVALGFSNKAIAEKLFISIHTVITHRKNITEKTGIKSISGLTVYSILNNLIDTGNINPEDLI